MEGGVLCRAPAFQVFYPDQLGIVLAAVLFKAHLHNGAGFVHKLRSKVPSCFVAVWVFVDQAQENYIMVIDRLIHQVNQLQTFFRLVEVFNAIRGDIQDDEKNIELHNCRLPKNIELYQFTYSVTNPAFDEPMPIDKMRHLMANPEEALPAIDKYEP